MNENTYENTPEYYADIYYLRTSPWGVAVTFAVGPPKDGIEGHDVAVVRLSHEAAKTLSMMLRMQLKKYERDAKTTIGVPPDVLNNLGLAPEDW